MGSPWTCAERLFAFTFKLFVKYQTIVYAHTQEMQHILQ